MQPVGQRIKDLVLEKDQMLADLNKAKQRFSSAESKCIINNFQQYFLQTHEKNNVDKTCWWPSKPTGDVGDQVMHHISICQIPEIVRLNSFLFSTESRNDEELKETITNIIAPYSNDFLLDKNNILEDQVKLIKAMFESCDKTYKDTY